MNFIDNFLDRWHHFINPHCEICSSIEQENKICQSCETLKEQLALANENNRLLLQNIVNITNPPSSFPNNSDVETKPELPKFVPWRVRREMFEQAKREEAKALKKKKSEIEIPSLEEEMKIVAKEKENAS